MAVNDGLKKKKHKSSIQSAETRLLRSIKGCSRRNHLRNENTQEFEVFNLNDCILNESKTKDRYLLQINELSSLQKNKNVYVSR